ncbi:MAG TPA: hypothetical protein VN193_04180 [Candidatus Angelobacter sp.]|nr:hypothetical protein [Candidatus Angelobacter sp.]
MSARRVPQRAIQSSPGQRLEGHTPRSTTTEPVLRLRPRARARRLGALLVAVLALAAGGMVLSGTPARAAFASGAKLPELGSGRVWSVAASPDGKLLLAGTDNGVYRSEDGGATWLATSLKGTRVWTVGFDARQPNPAFAGLDQKGVSRSDDGGRTWVDASSGLTNLDARTFGFGLQGIAVGTRSGVDVSVDGKQWRSAGLDGFSVSSLAVAANQPQLVLIAGVDGAPAGQAGFLFRNTGGGVQWETLQSGLPGSAVVTSVSAGPLPTTAQPRPLVVTTSKGTFHSGDGGGSWTSSTGVPDGVSSLTASAFSPADPNLVYAGADAGGSTGGTLLRSTDSGTTFAVVVDALPAGQGNVTALAVVPGPPPTVVAAVNPPAQPSSIYHGADAAAPAPGGSAPDSAGAALPSSAPSAKATPKPAATPGGSVPPPPATGIRHVAEVVANFPFPLILEVAAIAVIVYLVVRWRRRYLDVEGPP